MIYKSIVGSRSYGLDLPTSDLDVAQVSSRRILSSNSIKRIDRLNLTIDKFTEMWSGSLSPWLSCQWFFPKEFCIENDLSKWLVENREEIIKIMLPEVYNSHMKTASPRYRMDNKGTMYAIHFRNMLANYAEGMPFAEAYKAKDEDRDFLLSVRTGLAYSAQVLEEVDKATTRAENVADFYLKADIKNKEELLKEFKYMTYKQLDLERQ